MNLILIIIALSIFFQLLASALSLRLIFLTQRYIAWIVLSVGFLFMALRRFFVFLAVFNGTLQANEISSSEYTALLISILLSIGTYFMIPIFKSIKQSENDLAQANKQLIKQKEAAEESELFLQNVFENIPDMIFIKDAENLRFVNVNKAGEELLGISRKELINKNDYDFFPKEQADFFTQKDRSVLQTDYYLTIDEEKIQTQSGEKLLYTKKIAIRDKKGNNKYLLGISENITEKKKMENKLLEEKQKAEESTNRLLTFINSIPDIVCYKDGVGRWLLANNADLEVFMLKNVDYFGKTDAELSEYTHEIFKDAFKACLASDELAWQKKTISKGIETITNAEGVSKVFDVYKVPVYQENGERKGLAVIGRDITQMVEIQQNLILAKQKAEESDQLKMAFLQNMSHEIRTPLNAICGFAALLATENLSTQKRDYFINTIQTSSNRLLEIVSDILTISSLETNQEQIYIEKFNLEELLTDIHQKYKEQAFSKNLFFDLLMPHQNFSFNIHSDKSVIMKVLSNLISNAIKFTHVGSIEYGFDLINEHLQFFVRDTGIGLTRDKYEIIFENFRQAGSNIQANYGGTGLGLSIAKAYVHLLGGKIWLESEPEKGSVFYFSLPYQPVL